MKAFAGLILTAIVLVSCHQAPESGQERESSPTLVVVNYPLAWFAERLAGDFATVVFEVPADEDPAFWRPGDEAIARIQEADLIFLNGASYAKWVDTTSLPFEATVDTSAAFADAFIEVEEAVTHSHGEGDPGHTHGGTAFTTWLDFTQAAAQATAVATAITEEWPDRKETVLANLQVLHDELKELEGEMAAATASLQGAPLIASHPVYEYWARANDLEVHSLLWEPGMELDESDLAELDALMEDHPGAKYFVWEGEPLAGHAEKLEARGLISLVVSPCGNRPESGDFLTVMKDNIAALRAATR